MRLDRHRGQVTLRLVALAFVVAWLFSPTLQGVVPWWLAFAILAATELEFLVRGLREPRGPRVSHGTTRAPGAEDADLGWGTLIEDDDGARWIPPPARAPGPRRWPAALATAAVAAVLLVVTLHVDDSRTWDGLDAASQTSTLRLIRAQSSRIARRPVIVQCDRDYAFTGARSDALGVAFPGRGIAFLDPAICRAIDDLRVGHHVADDRAGEAILVLAHEAVHLGGELDEGVTECRALQVGVDLGRRLGLPEDRAARLMRARFASALAERNVVRAAYALPRGCDDGGAYDLDPTSSRFP